MTEEQSAPATPAPRATRPGRWKRNVVRTLVVALLLVALALITLLVTPVPIPGLTQRVEERLREVTESDARVGSVRFWLFDQQVVLRDVVLPSSTGYEPLWLDEVEIDLHVTDWNPTSPNAEITSVRIAGVRGVELLFDQVGLRQRGVPRHLITWPQRGEQSEGLDLDNLRLPNLEISGANMLLTEVRPAGEYTFLSIGDFGLKIFTDEDRRFEMATLAGTWGRVGDQPRQFSFSTERRSEDSLAVIGYMERIDSAALFPMPGELHVVGEKLHIHSEFNLSNEETVIETDLRGEEIRWAVLTGAVDPTLMGMDISDLEDLRHANPEGHVTIRLGPQGRRWLIDASTLKVGNTEVTLSGELLREPGLPMNLNFSATDSPTLLALLKIFLKSHDVDLQDGQFALDLSAKGRAIDPETIRVEGHVQMSGIDLSVGEDFPLEGRDFEGRVDVLRSSAEEHLMITNLQGEMEGIDVRLTRADVVRGMSDLGNLRYITTARIRASSEIASLLDRLPFSLDSQFAQSPSGTAALDFEFSDTLWPEMPEDEPADVPPILSGVFRLSDFQMELAVQPGLLRIDEMDLDFGSHSVRTGPFRADFEGHPLNLEASLTGDERFWQRPYLDATGQIDLDIEDALEFLRGDAEPLPFGLTGDLMAEYTASGPLSRREEWTQMVRLVPEDIAMVVEVKDEEKTLTADGGEVRITPASVMARDIGLDLNGVPLTFDGLIASSAAGLVFALDDDIEKIVEGWRNVISLLILDGPVEGELKLEVDLDLEDASMFSPSTYATAWSQLRPMLEQHVAGEYPEGFRVRGEFQGHDVEVTPTMSPVRFTGLEGGVTFDGHVLRAGDAPVMAGEDSGWLERLEYDSRPPFRLEIEARTESARIDPYLGDWQKPGQEDLNREERRHLAYDFGQPNLRSDVSVRVRADELRLRNIVTGPAEGVIEQWFDRAAREAGVRVTVEEMELCGGSMIGVIDVLSEDEGLTQSFTFHTDEVDLEQLVSMVTSAEGSATTGKVTGDYLIRRGPGQEWADVTGEGNIRIEDCNILESRTLRQAGRLFPSSMELGQSTLTSDFKIGDQRIRVEKLFINGGVVNVSGDGHIGFDKSLNLDVQIETIPQLVQRIPLASQVAGLVNEAMNAFLVSASVSGTIDRPQINVSQPLVEGVNNSVVQPLWGAVTAPTRWLGLTGSQGASPESN